MLWLDYCVANVILRSLAEANRYRFRLAAARGECDTFQRQVARFFLCADFRTKDFQRRQPSLMRLVENVKKGRPFVAWDLSCLHNHFPFHKIQNQQPCGVATGISTQYSGFLVVQLSGTFGRSGTVSLVSCRTFFLSKYM